MHGIAMGSSTGPGCSRPKWGLHTCINTKKQVTNALVRAFVEVERGWIEHVMSLPDPQARLKKVRKKELVFHFMHG